MTNKIIVKENEAGERLDIFLAMAFSEYSRSYFSKLIKEELVKVNNSSVKASYLITCGDKIEINFVEEKSSDVLPEKIKLNIIYENDDVIVLNKQSGIVVHPAAGNKTGTLVNALLYHFPKIKEAVYQKENEISRQRPGLVHRLDKDTSGVMIVAKNSRAMHSLSRQIQSVSTPVSPMASQGGRPSLDGNRTIKKIYWALCCGWPKEDSGKLVSYLGRHPKNRKLIADIGEKKGKEAVSYYKVLHYFKDEHNNKISLIEFNIKTGRTHQIRVQISNLGCPVLGDNSYTNKSCLELSERLQIKRQLLHAKLLEITLPGDSKPSTFEAQLPEDFSNVLNLLRQQ